LKSNGFYTLQQVLRAKIRRDTRRLATAQLAPEECQTLAASINEARTRLFKVTRQILALRRP